MRALGPLFAAILTLVGVAATAPSSAAAGVGIGLFVGEPTGVTIKADLQRRTALEVLVGGTSWRDGRGTYGHVTFLASPFVARGQSVLIPFRIGFGGALYEGGDDLGLAARVPFQLAFQFRSNPLELYLELSLRLVIFDGPGDGAGNLDGDGGGGLRFYF